MTTENNTPAETPAVAAPLSLEANPTATPAVAPQVEDKTLDKGVEVVTYNPTGDDRLDMMLAYVGGLGYAPDAPAMKRAIDGDFSMLEAELAAKDAKGYQAYIALGKSTFTDMRAKTEAKQAEDRKAVESAVGGAEAWADIQKWASANADENERTEISAALKAGGFQARAAAAWLKQHYDRANNVSTEGEGPAVSAGAKGAPASNGALSPQEYAREVAKARVGFRGDFENSGAYKALQSRRLAYRG